jgi:DNA-binding LacI/PurR family transcriptional regulator
LKNESSDWGISLLDPFEQQLCRRFAKLTGSTLHGESSREFAHFGGVFPVVAFARRVAGLDYVGIDNEQGALLAIEHLYRIGHRRIAFLGGNPNHLLAMDDRLKGYQRALSQLKVKFDPLLVVPSDLNRRCGFDGVQKLIKAKNPPTAVLCFNDVVALGAMEGIQRLGRKPGVDFGIRSKCHRPEIPASFSTIALPWNDPRRCYPRGLRTPLWRGDPRSPR